MLWIPNNNFFPDSGNKTKIVLHGTAGGTSAQNIANYFISTENSDNPVSTHYIIGQDGVIVQTVQEKDGAWGNGVVTNSAFSGVNPNMYTISIEHVKQTQDNSDILTLMQANSSFMLIKDICRRWGLHYSDVISHADIDPINRSRCPGPYPWTNLQIILQGSTPVLTTPSTNQLIAANKRWDSVSTSMGTFRKGSGIYNAWLVDYINGVYHGPPMSAEYNSVDWSGTPIIVQEFMYSWVEWYQGTAHWYPT